MTDLSVLGLKKKLNHVCGRKLKIENKFFNDKNLPELLSFILKTWCDMKKKRMSYSWSDLQITVEWPMWYSSYFVKQIGDQQLYVQSKTIQCTCKWCYFLLSNIFKDIIHGYVSKMRTLFLWTSAFSSVAYLFFLCGDKSPSSTLHHYFTVKSFDGKSWKKW